jgi:hypothetical protein
MSGSPAVQRSLLAILLSAHAALASVHADATPDLYYHEQTNAAYSNRNIPVAKAAGGSEDRCKRVKNAKQAVCVRQRPRLASLFACWHRRNTAPAMTSARLALTWVKHWPHKKAHPVTWAQPSAPLISLAAEKHAPSSMIAAATSLSNLCVRDSSEASVQCATCTRRHVVGKGERFMPFHAGQAEWPRVLPWP